jgi:hypothetical protein
VGDTISMRAHTAATGSVAFCSDSPCDACGAPKGSVPRCLTQVRFSTSVSPRKTWRSPEGQDAVRKDWRAGIPLQARALNEETRRDRRWRRAGNRREKAPRRPLGAKGMGLLAGD